MKDQGGDVEVTNGMQGGRKGAKVPVPRRPTAWVGIMVFAGVHVSLMGDARPKNCLSQIGHNSERFSLKCRLVM